MTVYNEIGKHYNKTRAADSRILDILERELKLSPPAKIMDIGAGTGNYSYELVKRGYSVDALEPAQIMRKQGQQHENLTWLEGFAEAIPAEPNTYDGAISTLATQHFKSREKALQEIHRILKPGGRLVLFTIDPRIMEPNCWLKEYFFPFYKIVNEGFPPKNEIQEQLESLFNTKAEIIPFKLPGDLKDNFFYAGWRQPANYLNEDYRSGMSIFAKAKKEMTEPMISRLKTDLADGTWIKKFGYVLELAEYEGGFYFLSIPKAF